MNIFKNKSIVAYLSLLVPVLAIVLGAVCAERALNALEEKEREREEMIRIYGGDRLAQPSKNKFRVLLREEMDDDDAIEAISKPTFKRDPKSIYTPTLGEAPRPVKNDSDANAGKRITFG